MLSRCTDINTCLKAEHLSALGLLINRSYPRNPKRLFYQTASGPFFCSKLVWTMTHVLDQYCARTRLFFQGYQLGAQGTEDSQKSQLFLFIVPNLEPREASCAILTDLGIRNSPLGGFFLEARRHRGPARKYLSNLSLTHCSISRCVIKPSISKCISERTYFVYM